MAAKNKLDTKTNADLGRASKGRNAEKGGLAGWLVGWHVGWLTGWPEGLGGLKAGRREDVVP